MIINFPAHNPIPHDSLAEGIMHGPYRAAPSKIIGHYVLNREVLGVDGNLNEAQWQSDIESMWQYDNHSAAVEEALGKNLITPEHAVYMYEKILRPWFTRHRNARER